MPKLILIHGVGSFDQEEILEAVQRLGSGYGIAKEDVSAFNWDERVDRVIGAKNFNREVLSRISESSLNAANLGFASGQPYAGIPLWYLAPLNALALLFQVFALGWLPVLVISSTHVTSKRTALYFVCTLAAIILCTMLVSATPIAAMRAVVRRIVFTAVWPFLFLFGAISGAAIFLAFLAMGLAVLAYFDRQSDAFHYSTVEGVIVFVSAFSLFFLVQVGAMVSGRPIELILSPVLKIFSDVLRYVGLPEYRSRLIGEFSAVLRTKLAESDHVIICAHSLGSVIAVDALMNLSSETGEISRLDLITMGSPLKRIFYWGFPQLFASPEIVFNTICTKSTNFRWVNIYRPLDWIGASLGTRKPSSIVDASTHQILKYHTGYWNDPCVAKKIASALLIPPLQKQGTAEIADNWPVGLTQGYQGNMGLIWRYRARIVKWLILAPLVVLIGWQTRHLLHRLPHAFRFFWVTSSIPEILLVVVFGVIGVAGWAQIIRKLYGTMLVPFLEMFYGTLPYINAPGIARPQDDPRYAPVPRWGWLLKRTAALLAGILVLLAILAWIDRSWVSVAKPLAVSNIVEYSLDESVVYFTEYGLFAVVGPRGRGQQTYHRTADGCYRPAGPWKRTDYNLHSSNRRGLITLIRSGGGNASPLRCSVHSASLQSEIPSAYCSTNKIAISDSGRYVAVIENTGYGIGRLLIRDTLEKRDLSPVELGSPATGQLAFVHDESLVVLHDERINTYSHLESDRPTVSPMKLPSGSRIQAFAVDGEAALATIDLDGHLIVYDHGYPASRMKAAKSGELDAPLISFSSDGNTLALIQNGYAEFYDWHRHDYLAHFFDRQKDANACSSQ
jgi:hypothetical protein